MPIFEQRTEIEEVYHDLDRVASTLEVMAAAPQSYSVGVVELLKGKVLDSARRLERIVESPGPPGQST